MQRETQAKDQEEQKEANDKFASLYQAAEQGDAEAQYQLGWYYYIGNGG